MFEKKCDSCAKRIDRKFNYCPYCGGSFKVAKEEENFGFLGRDDNFDEIKNVIKMPFGMEKIVNSLIKQIERDFSNNHENYNGMPKGLRINISTGRPQIRQVIRKEPRNEVILKREISDEEANRRMNIPKVNAKSKVRRLSDKIIYEINAPGVKEKEDVLITRLATGLEIKAYSKNKCYVKFIPLTVEVIKYFVKDEKVLLELKV